MILNIKKLLFFIFVSFYISISTSLDVKANIIEDYGLISIMYHRFGESKYPSTNIGVKEFKKHLEMIEKEGIKFIDPRNFEAELKKMLKKEKF